MFDRLVPERLLQGRLRSARVQRIVNCTRRLLLLGLDVVSRGLVQEPFNLLDPSLVLSARLACGGQGQRRY